MTNKELKELKERDYLAFYNYLIHRLSESAFTIGYLLEARNAEEFRRGKWKMV